MPLPGEGFARALKGVPTEEELKTRYKPDYISNQLEVFLSTPRSTGDHIQYLTMNDAGEYAIGCTTYVNGEFIDCSQEISRSTWFWLCNDCVNIVCGGESTSSDELNSYYSEI